MNILGNYKIHQNYQTFDNIGMKTFESVDSFFVSKDKRYYAIEGTIDNGWAVLRYYNEDGTYDEVYNEHTGWANTDYQYLSFCVPTSVDENSWDTFMHYHMSDDNNDVSGWYRFADDGIYDTLLWIPTASNLFQDRTGNVYYSYETIANDGIYYNDYKVTDDGETWITGTNEIKIKDGTKVGTPIYDHFTYGDRWTKVYQITYMLDGLIKSDVLSTNLNSSIIPYPVNSIMQEGDTYYQVTGYYWDIDMTQEVDFSIVNTLSDDVNIYIKRIGVAYPVNQKYQVKTLSIEAIYPNLTFKTLHENSFDYNAIKSVQTLNGMEIYYYHIPTSSWILARDGDNGWTIYEYQFVEFRDSYLPYQLDIDIIQSSGHYAYKLSYVTHTTDVVSPDEFAICVPYTFPTLSNIPTDMMLYGWYYDSLYTIEAHNLDVLTQDTTLYARIGYPTSLQIYLYENKDVNNAIDKIPLQKGLIEGTFKNDVSIRNPIVTIEYGDIDFNYVYIPQISRYYYVEDVVLINKNLKQLYLKVDVLMSFKDVIRNKEAIIKRSASDFNPYISDERMTIMPYKNKIIIESTIQNPLKTNNVNNNFVVIGAK